MQHRARKRFGQNFLQDTLIINRILAAIAPEKTDNLIEIGPGLGALTRPLINAVDKLSAVEIDDDLQQYLQDSLPNAKEKLNLIHADALTVDYQKFGENLRIVGNLPYNISTPLLINFLQNANVIKDMHFMLQHEVVARITAEPGSKTYGRLSVMVQYYYDATYLFKVPPTSFNPQPKVDSAIVRLTPLKPNPYPELPFAKLEKVVAKAFSMRRKTLSNNLKPFISREELISLDIDPQQRPEQISVADFTKIVQFIKI